jgi:hypothetical protein
VDYSAGPLAVPKPSALTAEFLERILLTADQRHTAAAVWLRGSEPWFQPLWLASRWFEGDVFDGHYGRCPRDSHFEGLTPCVGRTSVRDQHRRRRLLSLSRGHRRRGHDSDDLCQ